MSKTAYLFNVVITESDTNSTEVTKRLCEVLDKAFETSDVQWEDEKELECQHSWVHPGTSPNPTHCAKCGISYKPIR